MADDWWSQLLERLFGAQVESQQTRGAAFMDFGNRINTELERHEKIAAEAAASPTPTPQQPAQQQPNPNAREAEQVGTAIQQSVGTVPQDNDLYGSLPDGKVYMGNKRVMRGQNLVNSPVLEDVSEVIAQVNEWSPKKIKKFNDLAIDAGLLREPTKNLDDIERIWGSLAIRSAKMWQRDIGLTPWQLLERYGSRKPGDDAGRGGPVTTTTVNSRINITSPRDANALVDAALQQRLGRSPTDEEKKAFLEALNATEKKEPAVTKTTTTTSGSGTENISSTSNTTSSGGVDTSNFAREWSLKHNKDEAAEFQALSFYMPLFYQALESPV